MVGPLLFHEQLGMLLLFIVAYIVVRVSTIARKIKYYLLSEIITT
jgi:hypothetical protein